MDCREVERLLGQCPLGCLDPVSRSAVNRHLESCESCREHWKPERDSQWFRGVFSTLKAHSSVRDAVMARLDSAVVDS